MHILIADDEQTARLVLQKTLVKLGYRVTAAADGAEALAAFRRERCDVVITDWRMPKVDGLEVCRGIRSANPWDRYTYLIMLTALGGKESYLEAMNAGADDFITKPFDSDELMARLCVAERILNLESSLTHLERVMPTCQSCRRVRTPGGLWMPLDRYVAEHAPAHAACCPDCTASRRLRSVPPAVAPSGG